MMDQWYDSYSDYSGSGCSSGYQDDSSDERVFLDQRAAQIAIMSAVQNQPVADLVANTTAVVDVAQYFTRMPVEALAAISGVAALTSLPAIPPVPCQPAPKCSCKAHEGSCPNQCESAETAQHLNFRCHTCVRECPSSKCICSAHVLPDGVANRRTGIGSCSNEAEQGSLWCNDCRPTTDHLENPFSGSSCSCSCTTCLSDADSWNREEFLTSIRVTEGEMKHELELARRTEVNEQAAAGEGSGDVVWIDTTKRVT